jgi:NAD(P)-dependent dehydrogenase (short-subunit alcohol dehydrogenase family)
MPGNNDETREQGDRPRTALAGQVALVTGAGQGIGRRIALALARAGATIVVNDVRADERPEQVAALVRQLGREARVVRADVGRRGEVDAMLEQVVAAYGAPDILVANAGVNIYQPFLEIEQRVWDLTIGTDLTGVFNCAQATARAMVAAGRGGRIVVITSVSAETAYATQTHYCAAKAGVQMLVQGMALELGPHHINVNSIGPGWVETELTADYLGEEELRRQVEATIPWGRVAQPEEVADAVLFLCSPAARYMTGAHLRLDGGLIAGRTKV